MLFGEFNKIRVHNNNLMKMIECSYGGLSLVFLLFKFIVIENLTLDVQKDVHMVQNNC